MNIHFGGEAHAVPPGSVIGIIGRGSGELVRAASQVIAVVQDEADIENLRRSGSAILAVSQNPDFLRRAADEVWWVEESTVRQKGDPRQVLASYSAAAVPGMNPTLRRGDGRAELISIETEPSGTWRSGEEASVRVTVRFHAAVENPVVGIMIRTRIGMEVYGTNTELEQVQVGPCSAGATRNVTFRFRCDLCPQYYTITAASHDPDGVWHDWLEDAVAVMVSDARYTAGVANLRARVEITGSRE